MENNFKGIEKFIDPSKLNINEVPDYDDENIGQTVIVNSEGELEWTTSVNDTFEKIKGELEIIVEKIRIIKEEDLFYIKEEITGIIVEAGRILEYVVDVEKTVTKNKELFDDFASQVDEDIYAIYQSIKANVSSIEQLAKEIQVAVEEYTIKGAYTYGSNDIPTREWCNQVDPGKNALLNNFLFEQDSGWLNDVENEIFRLMFSGNQSLTIKNPLDRNGEYTTFTIDAWIKPYYCSECTLMDYIYLYDENGNVRIRTSNIDIRTTVSLETDKINHICLSVNIQSQIFKLYINGEQITLYETINTYMYTLPDILTLFSGFEGEVYGFKIYKKTLVESQILRNFKEGYNGQGFVMYYIVGCFEAMKATSLIHNVIKLSSTIDVLKESISLRVTKEEFDKAYGEIDESMKLLESSIKLTAEKITSTVAETYATKDGVNEQVTAIYSKIEQTAKDVTLSFTNATNGVLGDLSSFKDQVTTYFKFDENWLEIGKTNNRFKTRLSNEKLSFLQDGNEVAYISNNKMYITEAEIKSKLTLGGSGSYFDFAPKSNGNLAIIWRDS